MTVLRVSLISLLLLFQQVPPVDPENGPPEPGQPASCNNYHDTPAAHKCACGRATQECKGGFPDPPADVRMDKRCKTYCRAQHCQCAGHGCTS